MRTTIYKWVSFVLLILLPSCIMALTPNVAYNRRNGTGDFFAVSLAGGYSNMLTFEEMSTPIGFLGGSIGLGYERRVPSKNFWWSIMAEAECRTSVLHLNTDKGKEIIYADPNYTEGTTYDLTKWGEYPHYIFVSVPVLFGYMNKAFYVGAGPKIMLCPYGHNINKLSYTMTTADGTSNSYEVGSAVNLMDFNFNVAACFEVGGLVYDKIYASRLKGSQYRYHPYRKHLAIKIGFYAEYGFLSMNTSSYSGSVVSVRSDGSNRLATKTLFTTNSMTSRTINPFFAGVKLVLIYNSKEK